jgi:spore maturation protein B
VLILLLILFAAFKKVKLYDAFAAGAKGAFPLAVRIFPYLVTIFVLTELFEISGLSNFLSGLLAPVLKICGVPVELSKLLLIKPFSGSGSLALLSELYTQYGADSYISRCASVIYGSSETIFYVAAVYFAKIENKKLLAPIIIALAASFISSVFGCFLCLVM